MYLIRIRQVKVTMPPPLIVHSLTLYIWRDLMMVLEKDHAKGIANKAMTAKATANMKDEEHM